MNSKNRNAVLKLAIASIILLLCLAGPASAAALDPEKSAAQMIAPAEKAIERGLAYLASRQHEDGSFGSGPYRGNVAICGLVGTAFLAAGSTPGRGPYCGNVNRFLE